MFSSVQIQIDRVSSGVVGRIRKLVLGGTCASTHRARGSSRNWGARHVCLFVANSDELSHELNTKSLGIERVCVCRD